MPTYVFWIAGAIGAALLVYWAFSAIRKSTSPQPTVITGGQPQQAPPRGLFGGRGLLGVVLGGGRNLLFGNPNNR